MTSRISISENGDITVDASEIGKIMYKELRDATQRGVAVFGGAIIEEALQQTLACVWRNELGEDHIAKATQTVRNRMLGERGWLTFFRATELAYLTRLVGPEVHADLTNTRLVRNAFAHWTRIEGDVAVPEEVSFDATDINTKCDFKTLNRVTATLDNNPLPTATPRERFVAMTLVFFALFELYRTNPLKEPKLVDKVLRF
jgi:hypothetical protein